MVILCQALATPEIEFSVQSNISKISNISKDVVLNTQDYIFFNEVGQWECHGDGVTDSALALNLNQGDRSHVPPSQS